MHSGSIAEDVVGIHLLVQHFFLSFFILSLIFFSFLTSCLFTREHVEANVREALRGANGEELAARCLVTRLHGRHGEQLLPCLVKEYAKGRSKS